MKFYRESYKDFGQAFSSNFYKTKFHKSLNPFTKRSITGKFHNEEFCRKNKRKIRSLPVTKTEASPHGNSCMRHIRALRTHFSRGSRFEPPLGVPTQNFSHESSEDSAFFCLNFVVPLALQRLLIAVFSKVSQFFNLRCAGKLWSWRIDWWVKRRNMT